MRSIKNCMQLKINEDTPLIRTLNNPHYRDLAMYFSLYIVVIVNLGVEGVLP